MSTITIRLSEEQKKAIKGFSILKNKSISSVVLEAILNKIEDEEDYDFTFEDNYLKVNDEDLKEIKEKVRQINEKYGIYCRVPKNEVYYYVDDLGVIQQVRDYRFETDDKRYKIGNYFVTKDRAIVYLKQLLIFNQGNSNLFFKKEYWEI